MRWLYTYIFGAITVGIYPKEFLHTPFAQITLWDILKFIIAIVCAVATVRSLFGNYDEFKTK